MAILDDLEAAVSENTTVDGSAKLLLSELARLLQEAKDSGNPARVQAIIDALKADNASLADAVKAHTPAA